jgi:hypothetical protein
MSVWRIRVESESFDWHTGRWSVDDEERSYNSEDAAVRDLGNVLADFVAERAFTPRRHLTARVERAVGFSATDGGFKDWATVQSIRVKHKN